MGADSAQYFRKTNMKAAAWNRGVKGSKTHYFEKRGGHEYLLNPPFLETNLKVYSNLSFNQRCKYMLNMILSFLESLSWYQHWNRKVRKFMWSHLSLITNENIALEVLSSVMRWAMWSSKVLVQDKHPDIIMISQKASAFYKEMFPLLNDLPIY